MLKKGTSDESGYFEGDLENDLAPSGSGSTSRPTSGASSGSIEIVYENKTATVSSAKPGFTTQPTISVSVTPIKAEDRPQCEAAKGPVEIHGKHNFLTISIFSDVKNGRALFLVLVTLNYASAQEYTSIYFEIKPQIARGMHWLHNQAEVKE